MEITTELTAQIFVTIVTSCFINTTINHFFVVGGPRNMAKVESFFATCPSPPLSQSTTPIPPKSVFNNETQ